MAKSEPKLKQTRGQFRVEGIATGLDRDNAFRSAETKGNKPYKSLRIGVQTSPTNTVNVELFGMEQEFVYAYSRNDKETRKYSWDDRDNIPDEGYHLIGTNVALEQGLDGKLMRETFVPFEASEYIYDNLQDGDSIYVSGQVEFSEYDNGETVKQQTRFTIQSIGKTKTPIDFDSEDFKEVSEFEQEVVI